MRSSSGVADAVEAGAEVLFLADRRLPEYSPGLRAVAAQSWIAPLALEQGWPEKDLAVLGPLFPKGEERLKSIAYLNGVYERLLAHLHERLNVLHGTDHPLRFWELTLCSWLQVYLHILYDRHLRLARAACAAAPVRLTVPAPPLEPSRTRDYWDFVHAWTMDSRTSLAVYGELARRMDLQVREFSPEPLTNKPVFLPHSLPDPVQPANPPEVSHPGGHILGSTLHGPLDGELLRQKLGLSQFVGGRVETGWKELDRNLLGGFKPRDTFERIAADMLPIHLPTPVVEEFTGFCRAAGIFSGYEIYHSGSWHSEGMLFRIISALGLSRGAGITGCQHGGAYGQYGVCITEWAERRFCDHFATWGWTDGDSLPARLQPLPQMHLGQLAGSWKPDGGKALWASNSVPMHTYRLQLYPQDADLYELYFEQRGLFLEALSEEAAAGLRFRPYLWDHGWHERERSMLAARPLVEIHCGGSLQDAVKSARLFICDHMGTGMLFALLAGTPTVLFWDAEQSPVRDSAKPYFDVLLEARILFHDPVAAARHVNAVWEDVDVWWGSAPVRAARERFLERFCLTGQDWLARWEDFFEQARPR